MKTLSELTETYQQAIRKVIKIEVGLREMWDRGDYAKRCLTIQTTWSSACIAQNKAEKKLLEFLNKEARS